VEQIYRSSRHLSALIDDILDLAAVGANQLGLVLEQVEVGDVVNDAISIVEALFRARNLELKVEIDPQLPRLLLDPTRVRQVLLNLLTNASRYTRMGGVVVRVFRIDDVIQVSVQDTGEGIAAEDVPRVFQEFGRIDRAGSYTQDGTGLGMPLSKRLVELHGGEMWLESELSVGTTFYFTLPISLTSSTRLAAVERHGTMPHGEHSACRKGLLVYDTDPLLLHTLRRHLEGYDIVGVGEDDLLPTLIERYEPVALVADERGSTGCGVRLSGPAGLPPNLPIIEFPLRSGLASTERLGVYDYLLKPVTRPRLLSAINGLAEDIESVLVVDDDPQLVELLCRMLESVREGILVDRAFNGDDALRRIQLHRYDLVLLDLVMPGTDGMAVLDTLRKDQLLADVPVIVVSGRDYLEHAGGAHSLSVNRGDSFTGAELLHYLQVLVDTLPIPSSLHRERVLPPLSAQAALPVS
jgi:CheY-like chemotaxis protein